MIRPFTVFCKLNQISFSDRQWFEQEAGSLSHTDGICPVCHAKACLSPFASYTRYLVEWKEDFPVTYEVNVQRYRCSSCGHTLARPPVPWSPIPLIPCVLSSLCCGTISCTGPVYRRFVSMQESLFLPSTVLKPFSLRISPCGWGPWKPWLCLRKHSLTVWTAPSCRVSAGNSSFHSSSVCAAPLRIRRPAHRTSHPAPHKTGMEIRDGFC